MTGSEQDILVWNILGVVAENFTACIKGWPRNQNPIKNQVIIIRNFEIKLGDQKSGVSDSSKPRSPERMGKQMAACETEYQSSHINQSESSQLADWGTYTEPV